jgi:hypothetical protein
MSEPNTSEPLHSSCRRQATRVSGRPSFATSPKKYTVMPPIGGRNTLRSGRVTSSGNMPAVCSKSARLRALSFTSKRLARPGRYQTGSMAALVTRTSPLRASTSPSGCRRPAATASFSSGMLMCALVIAIVGRTSAPAAISPANTEATTCPQGSIETILAGSAHCGCGPTRSAGAVSVRSGRWSRCSAPEATARARYTAYAPAWVPMALRCAMSVRLAITGPRPAAVGAPQWISWAGARPWPLGCEDRTMWSEVRLCMSVRFREVA